MALFIRYVGHRNSEGNLTEDSFTQANPADPTTTSTDVSTTLANQTNSVGVLGGSVAFTRPDVGNDFIGGPGYSDTSGTPVSEAGAVRPLGLFINDAVGNAFENTPGVASGKGPYTSSQGTYVVDLYETQALGNGTLSDGTAVTGGSALTWTAGLEVYASVNGLLTPNPADSYEVVHGGLSAPTVLGIVKEAPTAASATLKLDQRV